MYAVKSKLIDIPYLILALINFIKILQRASSTQVGISKANSAGCYYVVRNQAYGSPGGGSCTDVCNQFVSNIVRAPDGGNGSPPSLGAMFFQCYKCNDWQGWPFFGNSCPNWGNPTYPNGITDLQCRSTELTLIR